MEDPKKQKPTALEVLKKIGLGLLNFTEVVMPVIALTVTFLAFIVNVVTRYILHKPVNACYELCLIGLLWCLLLSAPYAVRKHNNVAFTLIYDKFSPSGQRILRMVGDAFLIFCFVAMLYPCYDWVMFMHRKSSATLKIRFDVLYFPFVIFNVLTIGHLTYDFVKDAIDLVREKKGDVKA